MLILRAPILLLALAIFFITLTTPVPSPPPFLRFTPAVTRSFDLMVTRINMAALRRKTHHSQVDRFSKEFPTNQLASLPVANYSSTGVFEVFEPTILAACVSFDIAQILDLFFVLPRSFSRPFRAAKFTMFVARSSYSNAMMAAYVYTEYGRRLSVSSPSGVLKKKTSVPKDRKPPPDSELLPLGILAAARAKGHELRARQTHAAPQSAANNLKILREKYFLDVLEYLNSVTCHDILKLLFRYTIMIWGLPDPAMSFDEIMRLLPKTKFQFAALGVFWALILSWGSYTIGQVR